MITPVNSHLLIDPVKHDSFVVSQRETFEEIGVVVAVPEEMNIPATPPVSVGDKVYFDSWLAAKFPKNEDGDFYWLVKFEDVRAVEYAQQEIPEQ
jgi:co-chaperonin GroES (HSP10)